MSLKSDWETKVNDAKKVAEEWKDKFRVDTARQYFEGAQRPSHIRKEDWITLNMIYSHLMAQLPSLYSVDPYFYVKLKRTFSPDPRDAALWDQKGQSRQAYLNYLKGELNLKQKARLAIQDAHFSFGVLKIFYVADLKENDRAGEPLVDEKGDKIIGDDGEPLLEPDVIPVNGRYEIKRVHPDNFLFDCEAGVLEEEWGWLGEIFTLTFAKVKKDKRFKPKIVKQIEARLKKKVNSRSNLKDKKRYANMDEEPIEFIEIYDLNKNEWFIWTEQADDLAMEPRKIPAAIDKHPFKILRFVMRDKSALPVPPMSQGIDPQREYNEARTQIMIHRKRFNRKYEVNVQALEDADNEISKLESGEDGTVIRKIVGDRVVTAIQDAPLDVQRYTELGFLKNDMVELLGAPESLRGIAGADSATEASILDSRLEVKEGDRLSIVVDWLTGVASNLDKLVQAHIQRDEAVRIQGPDGEFWSEVKVDDYEDILGEYQYSVNIGATQPRLPQIERAQWIAFWSQVVIPMPAILTKPRIMKKFAEMFGIENDTMLEDLRQLGLEMMQNPPQQQGSAPGVSEVKPESVAGGQAGGLLGGILNQLNQGGSQG